MYHIADPKLFHSNFPGKISAEETAYRKSVDALVKKVDFLSNVLSFLESDISMTAYFTRGQELYFVILDTELSGPKALLHKHDCICAEDENINTFSSAMDLCQAKFVKKHSANLANLVKHLGELEKLYLDVLSCHADL